METLKIKIPEGFEVDSFDKSTGEVKFKQKPVNVMERIKTLDDILEYHGLSDKDMRDVKSRFVVMKSAHLYYQYLAELLCQALNEGWEPDWDDLNESKYYPWFKLGSSGFRFYGCGSWLTCSTVGSRLCFKSSELAKHAGNQFAWLYEKFMIKAV